jgi:hypothetical protein
VNGPELVDLSRFVTPNHFAAQNHCRSGLPQSLATIAGRNVQIADMIAIV